MNRISLSAIEGGKEETNCIDRTGEEGRCPSVLVDERPAV
jgi:hypothetical protein